MVAAMLLTASFNTLANPNQCFARAMPNKGHGGNAWAQTIGQARDGALNNCRKYASQTGGDPNTCKITEAWCKNSVNAVAPSTEALDVEDGISRKDDSTDVNKK